MTTFDGLVSRVRQQTLAYTQDQAPMCVLSADMAPGDTAFTVDPASLAGSQLGRGLVELDDELVMVQSYDRTSGTVQVLGGLNGRGCGGSTAAAHTAQSIVTTAPRLPRVTIKQAINDTILGVYPSLVTFGEYEFSRLAPVFEYELPADVDDVWYVTASIIGPSQVWQPMVNWRYNPMADTATFPSGKSLQQLDYVTPGRSVRVIYVKPPSVLVNGSDDFESTSGLPGRVVDLITYGALQRLAPALEAARLQMLTVEASQRSQLVPPGSATRVAQLYAQLYQQRLAEERTLMFANVPNYQAFQGS